MTAYEAMYFIRREALRFNTMELDAPLSNEDVLRAVVNMRAMSRRWKHVKHETMMAETEFPLEKP